ncbi:hypothetical protein [Pseudonocardia nigra]|uniref:hypothetical protein n=1 Tax=Pseudonocardia nigra TaxID=1921578 RepID=UPI001C5E8156|nr:hypothetical protein [Pseudonocardia nigra]
MEVTENDIKRIPVGNLRVPRAEFAAVWAAAQRRCREQGDRGITDWYAAGVASTCQWMAGAIVEAPNGARFPAYSPVTDRTTTAYEELIEAEYQAAELLDVRRPDLLEHRPGWCEAIRATLRWAWRRNGPPPLHDPTPASTAQ